MNINESNNSKGKGEKKKVLLPTKHPPESAQIDSQYRPDPVRVGQDFAALWGQQLLAMEWPLSSLKFYSYCKDPSPFNVVQLKCQPWYLGFSYKTNSADTLYIDPNLRFSIKVSEMPIQLILPNFSPHSMEEMHRIGPATTSGILINEMKLTVEPKIS